MLRWGDREAHSYIIGVFSTRELAHLAGEAEKTWRAVKYEFSISQHELDFIHEDKLKHHNTTI